jgi:dihydrofolate synthase/folylpolyglutamate synthase
MSSFSAEEYLKTFANWETQPSQALSASFSVELVHRLLCVFHDPDEKLRFVHVAGTKGKGSSAAFLASILRASGYRTGLYTSPHLHSLCERIRVLEPAPADESSGVAWDAFEGMITPDEIARILEAHQADIDALRAQGIEVTFYELMTVVAVAHFAACGVEIVVLETGLGGRLDATSAFETSVCGIAPIGFDHMNILGHTLAAIASEKAGIIKSPGQAVCVALQPAEALSVICERCAAFSICPSLIGIDVPCLIHSVTPEGVSFDVIGRRCYEDLFSPLTGVHQAENAALAIAMAEALEPSGFLVSAESVRQGILSVQWPARFEHRGAAPAVVLDCAHTAASARALAQTFHFAFPGRKAVLVLGMSADKDPAGFVRELGFITHEIILTQAASPRAMDLSPMAATFAGFLPQGNAGVRSVAGVKAALAAARQAAGADGLVIVTGSVFVCADARACLIGGSGS